MPVWPTCKLPQPWAELGRTLASGCYRVEGHPCIYVSPVQQSGQSGTRGLVPPVEPGVLERILTGPRAASSGKRISKKFMSRILPGSSALVEGKSQLGSSYEPPASAPKAKQEGWCRRATCGCLWSVDCRLMKEFVKTPFLLQHHTGASTLGDSCARKIVDSR